MHKRLIGTLLDHWEQTPNDVRSYLEEQHGPLVAALNAISASVEQGAFYADTPKGIKKQY